MRPGQQQHQQKRMRGRNNNNRKGPNPLSRSYESNGPDVKIRGTAAHIADKYIQLARDATSSGDPVAAENYFQHAEHYYRILAAAQPQYPQGQGPQGVGFVRADDESRDEDSDEDGNEGQQNNGYDNQQQPNGGYQQNAPQPYVQQGGEGGGGQQRRDYQPREQRDHQPREQRDYQPREQRPHNNPNPQNQNAAPREPVAAGLPAFITGGGASEPQAQNAPAEGEGGEGYVRGRGRRRFNNRYGRGAAPGEQDAPQGAAPTAEPEVTPGE